jgi:hypothetical protein
MKNAIGGMKERKDLTVSNRSSKSIEPTSHWQAIVALRFNISQSPDILQFVYRFGALFEPELR